MTAIELDETARYAAQRPAPKFRLHGLPDAAWALVMPWLGKSEQAPVTP
jgi:hypothetical protein